MIEKTSAVLRRHLHFHGHARRQIAQNVLDQLFIFGQIRFGQLDCTGQPADDIGDLRMLTGENERSRPVVN